MVILANLSNGAILAHRITLAPTVELPSSTSSRDGTPAPVSAIMPLFPFAAASPVGTMEDKAPRGSLRQVPRLPCLLSLYIRNAHPAIFTVISDDEDMLASEKDVKACVECAWVEKDQCEAFDENDNRVIDWMKRRKNTEATEP